MSLKLFTASVDVVVCFLCKFLREKILSVVECLCEPFRHVWLEPYCIAWGSSRRELTYAGVVCDKLPLSTK